MVKGGVARKPVWGTGMILMLITVVNTKQVLYDNYYDSKFDITIPLFANRIVRSFIGRYRMTSTDTFTYVSGLL